jgi:arylsulfatase A-like enzyme
MNPAWLLLPVVLSVSLAAQPGADARSHKPNVVVFLADDAGWGDFGHSGNQEVRTPHIDSLAREGVSLERFFVQPVCAPTRAEFLTGRYHPRGGVRGVSTGQERLDPEEKTVADAFRAAGYATGAFGKWHNGSQWPYHPLARGFDEYFGHTAGHWGEYFDAPLEENGRMIRTQGYIVDVCTDRALDFIKRNRHRPFFCYVPFTTPHSPWAVPEEYWRRLQNRPLSQTATRPEQDDPDHTRCALAMMENQDWNVGRVLGQLADLGLADNTVVLYFSDNGPNSWRWNGGMKGRKGSTDEGGVRSVAYLRWPGRLPAGHTVPQISGALDLLPTLTALAQIPRVGALELDGRDLSPLLLRQKVEWPDRNLFAAWAGRVSVRTQRHRLDDRGQLFDLVADPGQSTPLNDVQPETTAALVEAVRAWRTEMFGDAAEPVRSGGVDPRPFAVGYPEFPVTLLPARDGEPRGGVRRSSSAPNCSYFVNWASTDDRMVWGIEVITAGRYEVAIDYTCPLLDVGSTVELSFLGQRLTGRVTPGWDPPLHTHQDTLPRPAGESTMKDFRTLDFGEITLPKGQGPLTLRALEIPGRSVMDVRRVTLTLLRDSITASATWVGASTTPEVHLDGRSLAGVLRDAQAPSPHAGRALHWQVGRGANADWAVREGDWKLIGNARDTSQGGAPVERIPLFLANLASDPGEKTNLAGAHPDRVERLRRLHKQHLD